MNSEFEYNDLNSMDIDFSITIKPIDQIKADGYSIGVNHRPLRQSHVNKIMATFNGNIEPPIVIFDSRDQCYHIVQHQHAFTAYMALKDDKTIKCFIFKRKSTGIELDAALPQDRALCLEYSYRVTDNQERNCISDTVFMVMELSKRYQQETGKKYGVIEYIFDKQYGHKLLSRETIKLYRSYGEFLKQAGLLETAQKERWAEKIIRAKIKERKLSTMRKKEINIKLPSPIADEFKRLGLEDSDFWNDAITKGHAFNKNHKVQIFIQNG